MLIVSRFILLAALVVAPWFFGAVRLDAQVLLYGAVVISLAAWGGAVVRGRDAYLQSVRLPTVCLPVLAFLAVGGLQLLDVLPFQLEQMRHAVFADHVQDGALEVTGVDDVRTSGTIDPATTRLALGKFLIAAIAMFLGVQLFSQSIDRRWLYGAVAINGAALALFGIVQKVTWSGELFWMIPLSQGGNPFASYVNRNNAAGYLNLTIAAALGWLLLTFLRASQPRRQGLVVPSQRRSRPEGGRSESSPSVARSPWTLAAVGVLVAIVVGVIASLSRGGMLAMVVAGLCAAGVGMNLVSARAMIATLAVAVLGGLGLLYASDQLETVVSRLHTLTEIEAIAAGRLTHWQDTLRAVFDFPLLGLGLGSYPYAQGPYQAHWSHAWYFNADNQYVEMAVETGLCGMAAIIGGMALFATAVTALLRRIEQRRTLDAALVGLFLLVSQSIQAATDFGTIIPANLITMAVLIGSVVGAACRDRVGGSVSRWVSLARLEPKRVGMVVAILLILGGGYFVAETVRAERSFFVQDQVSDLSRQSTLSEFDAADLLARAERALQSRPDDAELLMLVGRLHVYRYRIAAHRELIDLANEPTPAQKKELWILTDPLQLQLLAMYHAKTGAAQPLADLQAQVLVTEELTPARNAFWKARAVCPLMRDVDGKLAKLAFIDARAPSDNLLELKRAMVIEPANVDQLYEIGLLAQVGGHLRLAAQAWRQCITLQPEYEVRIWRLAGQYLTPAEIVEQVLPEQPGTLVRLAEVVTDATERAALLSRIDETTDISAETSVASFDDPSLPARIARLQGRPAVAEALFVAAIRYEPEEVEHRLLLANFLEAEGRMDDAIDQLAIAVQLQPGRGDISKRLNLMRARNMRGEATAESGR